MKKSYQQKSWFILSSLLLHTLLMVSFWTSQFISSSSPLPEDYIEVTFSDHPTPQQQIVEQDEVSVNEEKPDSAKFLSAKNQKVNTETKVRDAGKFNNHAGAQEVKPTQVAKSKKLPSLKDLSPDSDWYVEKESSKEEQQQQMQAGRGPAKSQDYLKDTKEGQQTLLNTREFVYYSYYNRIRNQLQQYWEPSIKHKFLQLLKRGRTIASAGGDKLTKVLITLNKEGLLVKVQVLEESGVRDLDDAAVEAFQKAAPFPNPPAGIVEQDGTIKIRWDFVVEA